MKKNKGCKVIIKILTHIHISFSCRVSLQGRPDMFLNIKVHVVEQIIELFNISNDRKLECIRFGSVFFGTSKIEHALLFNNSPETVNWVAIMQDDCVGEELVRELCNSGISIIKFENYFVIC